MSNLLERKEKVNAPPARNATQEKKLNTATPKTTTPINTKKTAPKKKIE